jgi:hypothetical protein
MRVLFTIPKARFEALRLLIVFGKRPVTFENWRFERVFP